MATPSSPGHSAASRLAPLAGALIIMAVAALGYIAVTSFNSAVGPELDNRSQLIGTGIKNNIERALALGIPLEQITGSESYLLEIMASFPEVDRISIRTADGISITEVERSTDGDLGVVPLASQSVGTAIQDGEISGAFRFPILAGNSLAGAIFINIDRRFVEQQFTDVFLDVIVVVLVVLLLGFELMLATVSSTFSKPLDGLFLLLERQSGGNFSQRLAGRNAGRLGQAASRYSDHAIDLHERYTRLRHAPFEDERPPTIPSSSALSHIGTKYGLTERPLAVLTVQDPIDMRLPLFLFATGEELSKPFLPLLVRHAASDATWLSQEVLITLPFIAYLVALILLSPVAGGLAGRYGARPLFLAALVPVGVSHIGLSISDQVWEFVLWRGIAGAGYAVATIACQEYALQTCTPDQRGRALGGFVTVVIGGTFCGTALGGVLADRLGTSNTFLIGASLVVISGVAAYGLMSRGQSEDSDSGPALRVQCRSPFANPRFIGLLFGIAIPANVLMAAFLWYVVPLALSDLGSRPADIGRVLMIYYLITVLTVPLAARIVDRSTHPSVLISVGGAVSALGLFVLMFSYGFWPFVAAVAAAGLGHAIIRATQVPLALMIATTGAKPSTASSALGTLRTWERAGSVIGLTVTGMLVERYGYPLTITVIGALTVAGMCVFVAIEVFNVLRPHEGE